MSKFSKPLISDTRALLAKLTKQPPQWTLILPINYEIVNSKEGQYLAYFPVEHAIFRVDTIKRDSPVAYARCTGSNCGCRAIIKDGLLSRTTATLKLMHDHNDDADGKFFRAYKNLKEEIKQKAHRSVKDLHENAMDNLRNDDDYQQDTTGRLEWQNVQRTLNAIRSTNYPACRNRSMLEDLLNNNEQVKKTFGEIDGKAFYAGHVGTGRERSAVFLVPKIHERVRADLAAGKKARLHVDATFNILPLNYKQLLIVQAFIDGRARPLALVLMVAKNYEAYFNVFKFLKLVRVDAESFMSDFEIAERNAARKVWPGVSVLGCNFHFAQALRKNAVHLGVFKVNSGRFSVESLQTSSLILRMYMRLSLLPLEQVADGIEAIQIYTSQKNQTYRFKKFAAYFKKVWCNGIFTFKDWNVSELRDRTNNVNEAFNSSIKLDMKRNPSVYQFLNSLKKIGQRATDRLGPNKRTVKDRSALTEPMHKKLAQLKAGEIEVIDFLEALAMPLAKKLFSNQ